VVETDHGRGVLELTVREQPSLILLDVLLPGMNGIEVCRELRRTSHTPVIFMSCKNDDADIVLGLESGGDDYIIKPFSPNQLIARVKAHLRRNLLFGCGPLDPPMLHFSELEIDLLRHTVYVKGCPVLLSAKEFNLLAFLAKHPEKVYAIEELYEQIWNAESLGDTRTLFVHISNLRKKIESDPSNPRYIVTVRGRGYKFRAL